VKTQQTVNYNNSQTIERIIKAPGAINRLSVAVLLDQAALGAVTPDTMTNTIKAAIGADPARGDVVTVSAVAFAAADTSATAPAASALPSDLTGMAGGIASTVFGGLIALVLLFLVWRNVKVLRGQAEEMQLARVTTPEPGLLASYTSTGAGSPLATIAELDQSPQTKVQERLRMVAAEKPDAIVGLMTDWLREDTRR
jgi:flagellar M-ring protein FliF